MIYIGNDTVNLLHPANKRVERSARYLDKCYTPREQELVLSGDSPMENMWRLWSCKEAAYKVLKKMDSTLSFVPKQFEVSFSTENSLNEAQVHFGEQVIYCSTNISNGAVTTIASNHPQVLQQIRTQFGFYAIEDESVGARDVLLMLIGAGNHVEIKKDRNNIPFVYDHGIRRSDIDISLSHDYGMVSAAYLNKGLLMEHTH